ncbi:hypothetical protein [Nonomuraea sp. NPDC001831]
MAAHPDGVPSGAYTGLVDEAIPIDAGMYRNPARLDVTRMKYSK